jgi:hypothetical protein
MRFLFCKPVEPIQFSSRASNVCESDDENEGESDDEDKWESDESESDGKDEGKMSLCFVNVGDEDDSDDFVKAEKNRFYANYSIVYERMK